MKTCRVGGGVAAPECSSDAGADKKILSDAMLNKKKNGGYF